MIKDQVELQILQNGLKPIISIDEARNKGRKHFHSNAAVMCSWISDRIQYVINTNTRIRSFIWPLADLPASSTFLNHYGEKEDPYAELMEVLLDVFPGFKFRIEPSYAYTIPDAEILQPEMIVISW